MFEMSSLCANTRLQTFSSLTDGSIANALLQTTPDVNQALLEFINIVDPRLTDMLLYNSYKSCSQWGSGRSCSVAPEKIKSGVSHFS